MPKARIQEMPGMSRRCIFQDALAFQILHYFKQTILFKLFKTLGQHHVEILKDAGDAALDQNINTY